MNPIPTLHATSSSNDLTRLIDVIPHSHHQALRQKLTFVYRAIQRIARNHLVPLGIIDQLERRFLAMADGLETNLEEQECWLFALLRQLVMRGLVIDQPKYLRENLLEGLNRAGAANQETLHEIRQIQTFLSHPDWMDKGAPVKEMIDHLRVLDEAVTEHELLEREKLFPRVREMCESWIKEEEVSHAS